MTDQTKPAPPTLDDLIRTLALRDRLQVDGTARTADVSVGLRQVRKDRDQGQPGSRRLVRSPEMTASDLLRKWRDLPDDDEAA